MEPLLTVRETASLLNVCRTTLGKWRKSGELKSIPFPNSRIIRFDVKDILAFIERNRTSPKRHMRI